MSYQVLARKWRPRNFKQVVGQEHVLRALINALDNERLHHAYLFTGTRGVGKTTLGRILAKSLNCEKGITSSPCGECSACVEIDQGRFVDLLEVDAASRTKVDDTRDLLENVQYAPSRGRFKIYLIDEVHMLSDHSFNALLKTLEEPPPHVKFILATTDPQKIPITVLSRCLKFSLKNLTPDQISSYLATVLEQESIRFEPDALNLVADSAEGSMRDSLSLLDQIIAFGGGEVREADVREMLGTLQRDDVVPLLRALIDSDGDALLNEVQRLAQYGVDFTTVLDEVMALLHELAVEQVLPQRNQDKASIQTELAGLITPADVQLYYQIALSGRQDLGRVSNPRNAFEMLLIRMLAFQPAGFQPRGASGGRAQATATIPAIDRSGRPAGKSVERQQISKPVSAATPTPVKVQQQTVQPPSANIASTEVGEWRQVVNSLDLVGMARQLALNCTLQRREGSQFYLSLASAHGQLASRGMVERLQAAMKNCFGAETVVYIDVVGKQSAETPAQQSAREHTERLQAATAELKQDPSVQALEKTFNAQLDEKNVRLTD